MSQATLHRDHAAEDTDAPQGGFARSAVRVVLLSIVVTALVAGLYAAFGGNSADPLAGQGAGNTAAAPAVKGVEAAKPLSYEEKSKALAAKLPRNADTAERRSALLKYLKKMDIKVTAASSPATAASQACTLLRGGTSASELVKGVASGGEYTKAQSRAFLLGASSLYCSDQARKFR